MTTSVAVIVVSANNGQWLRPCLRTVFERAGEVDLDVVVVASGCTDETVPLVRREFPHVRILECENRGFAYANNVALRTIDSDWVLFLNPDTEILEGTFEQLASLLRDRTEIGVAAVRQLTAEGNVFPTIRRFPNALRTLSEALGSERFPFRAAWLGERELDLRAYERETECDWTTGAFMFVRREALASVGSWTSDSSFTVRRSTSAAVFEPRAGRFCIFPNSRSSTMQVASGESPIARPARVRPAPVHGEALLACPSRHGSRCAGTRLCAASRPWWIRRRFPKPSRVGKGGARGADGRCVATVR